MATGLLWHLLSKSGSKKSWWKDPRVWGSTLAGTGLASVAGTAGRRYFSNNTAPYGYGVDNVLEDLTPSSVGDAMHRLKRTVIDDLPSEKVLEASDDQHPAALLRRELMRRNMGLEDEGPDKFFTPNPDGSVRLNPAKLSGPGRSQGEQVGIDWANQALRDAYQKERRTITDDPAVTTNPASMPEMHQGPFAPLLAGHERFADPKGVMIRDKWTYELSPGEKGWLGDYAASQVGLKPTPSPAGLRKMDPDAGEYLSPGDSSKDVAKQLGSRLLADQVLDTRSTGVEIPVTPQAYPLQLAGVSR